MARGLRGGIVATLLALALPSAAHGAAWVQRHEVVWVPSGSYVSEPAIAADPSGVAVAAWTQQPVGLVQAAIRRAGDPVWRPAETISAPTASTPVRVAATRGTLFALWPQGSAGPRAMAASVRPAGASGWSAPVNVSSGVWTAYPLLAADAAGNAYAAWLRQHNEYWVAQAAVRDAATGTWSPAIDVSAPPPLGWASNPDLAVNARGDAVLAWRDVFSDRLQASYRPAGGSWSAPQDIAEGDAALVAVEGGGTAVAVYTRSRTIFTATRPPGGSWGSETPLSPSEAYAVALSLNEAGAGAALWQRRAGTTTLLETAFRSVAGSWGAPERVDASTLAFGDADLVVDASGRAVAVWREAPPPPPPPPATIFGLPELYGAVRPSGGPWSARTTIGGPDPRMPVLAGDGAGNTFATWIALSPRLEATGYDAAGPLLADLVVPETGRAGENLTFSVRSADFWSAVAGDPLWSFGDGVTANDTSVTHAYGSAGRYQVTVRQSDVLGNESVVTRTVTITSDPPPGPPRRRCVVPRVVGTRLATARQRIQRAGCRVGRIRRARSRRIRRGRVIAQSPRPRRVVARGTRVVLVVSRGR